MPKAAKPFEVLRVWGGKSMGTTIEHHELVKCPECGYEFVRDVSTGCFHYKTSPPFCSKCRYPLSYYDKLRKEYAKKQEEKETFNPSSRDK